ncbi:MAG: 50S ribosomal protein L3 [Candidatus Makana argininalis]
MKCLIGEKIGMTKIFTKEGTSIPVTIIKIENNYIIDIKNNKKEEYYSITLTTGIKKEKKIKKSEIGNFKNKKIKIGNKLHEFKTKNKKKLIIGDFINIKILKKIKKVDVVGISKGKGFAGTIKRWNFHIQDATHGNSLSHRAPGSIGQNQTPGRVFKGKKMSGHLGNKKITIQNLNIINIDIKNNLLLIKGSVPGSIGSELIIRESIKY